MHAAYALFSETDSHYAMTTGVCGGRLNT